MTPNSIASHRSTNIINKKKKSDITAKPLFPKSKGPAVRQRSTPAPHREPSFLPARSPELLKCPAQSPPKPSPHNYRPSFHHRRKTPLLCFLLRNRGAGGRRVFGAAAGVGGEVDQRTQPKDYAYSFFLSPICPHFLLATLVGENEARTRRDLA